jgi:hypothetical protein
VPTDPFVTARLDGAPRQQQNFAPGVHMPAAQGWRADRPGDGGHADGPLAGTPGPNVGFALALARRARDRFRLEPGEQADDAVAVVAELAMKRGASLGRAPSKLDVDFAIELLGYAGAAPEEVRRWRPRLVRGAAHDYVVRRAITDTVSASLLCLPLSELPEQLAAVRVAMERGRIAGHDDRAGAATAEAAPADGDR